MKRRKFLEISAITGSALFSGSNINLAKNSNNDKSTWPICLNTSTIRPATLEDKINAANKAGYDGIEIWINELEDYEKNGGSLKELGNQILEKNLYVPNIIGLWDCMPMNNNDFLESLPATKERMRRSSDVGSKYVAAIPAPDRPDINYQTLVRRYAELLKIGKEEYGITVAFEFVGFFKGIYQFGHAAGVALDTNNPDACLIMDTFHLFRGDSGFNNMNKINGNLIANFHINDVSNETPREEQGDKHRIYPGDGILPLVQLFKDLKTINYKGTLSLEMFNREHWKQDPYEVAQTGIDKIKKIIELAEV
ncbi:MAG: sugar phosphate isomerase/epimerase [Ignavibacteriales bacterium]|nr:sugar phosphate isomerase/epimerase [Ignavibacteriales bacterium]MCB9218304.1 sugar phosphate isomerase/epimerase [Ignavibacteriales bacterium]